MKVVFIGCVEFSKLLLEEILATKTVEVVGVATKQKSKINSDFYDLSEIAAAHKIESYFYDVKNPEGEMLTWIKSKSPDAIFCFGWSHLISAEVINYPKFGVIGYHPAELPKNRGRHPIIWALALGLEKTASTFFVIDGGADTGDIVSQEIVKILENDDARSLYMKLNEVAKIQIKTICTSLMKGQINRIIQNHSLANSWRKRNDKDGLIDWRMSSDSIHNLVRGLTKPYPGAYFENIAGKVIIWQTKKIDSNDNLKNLEPGKILSVKDGSFVIKTGDGQIEVLNYESGFTPVAGEYL